ncbi:MAG: phosphoribosylglycinamide formyltransferase [Actinomycetota bacterium]|nr:phosphoribosylglycinamide formyltransferase [Actinomycetota bacterium]
MIGVLVSGSGTNLQALIDAGLPVAAVASNKSGVRALARAESAGIATRVFPLEDYAGREERDRAMAEWLDERRVELVVCAGYMHLLTPPFLERFPGRIINVHPSLLPAFPGAHAVDDALAAGVRETGTTVHVVDEGLDSGPILMQERVSVLDDDTRETLHARIQAVEHRLLPQAARMMLERETVA